jgi:hypothetical protein
VAIEPEDTALPAPPPPPGLQAAGTRFWDQLHAEYAFDGSPELTLLVEETARTYDVIARLQAIIDTADTLRTRGSRGQDVAIPELDALRAYRAQFAALVKQLALPGPDDDEDDDTGRDGPMSRSEAGRLAAAARWRRKGH